MSARLACLIHAANVHSEPGSNPSKICFAEGFPSEFSKRGLISVCHPGQRVAVYNLPAKTHRLTNSIMLSKISTKRQCVVGTRSPGNHQRLDDANACRSASGAVYPREGNCQPFTFGFLVKVFSSSDFESSDTLSMAPVRSK
jgi:hypothetical protein